jgi:four helix bundle protein
MANVLIIDDDEDVTHLLRTCLAEQGHDVSVAHHGDEGLDQALKAVPDLIMLDVYLPDTTGFQVCSQFRSTAATQSTPIIMMTGATQFPEKKFGVEKGANEYIFKPFDVDEIAELMRKYLGVKRQVEAFRKPAATLPKAPEPTDDLQPLDSHWAQAPRRWTPPKPFAPKMVFKVEERAVEEPVPPAAAKPALEISYGYSDYLDGPPVPKPPENSRPAAKMEAPRPLGAPIVPPEPSPAFPEEAGKFTPGTPLFADRLMEFGLEVYSLAALLCRTHAEEYLAQQLLRTSLAVGARVQEARSAESPAHYLALMFGAVKDLRETGYWLALADRAGLLETRGKTHLEPACRSLTVLLENFVNLEKKRLLA